MTKHEILAEIENLDYDDLQYIKNVLNISTQEGPMEEHERQMQDDDDNRGFSNDDTLRLQPWQVGCKISEAERRMNA